VPVERVRVSPDGTEVAVVSTDGVVRRTKLGEAPADEGVEGYDVAWVADGSLVALQFSGPMRHRGTGWLEVPLARSARYALGMEITSCAGVLVGRYSYGAEGVWALLPGARKPRAIAAPAPDGAVLECRDGWIAAGGWYGDFALIAVDGTAVRPLPVGATVRGAAWLDDGRIALLLESGDVAVWTREGSEVVRLTR
jgi:hypothetical protein